jgi:hypothetical protein
MMRSNKPVNQPIGNPQKKSQEPHQVKTKEKGSQKKR